MDGSHALLTLQERDTELDQLRYRRAHLPERAHLDTVLSELAAVGSAGAAVSAQREELGRRQAQLETELAETERRLAVINRQMRSGAITASRDLQAMADQVEGLERRRSNLEDAELEVLEALDPVDAEVGALEGRWVELDGEASRLRGEVAEAEVALDGQVATVAALREQAVALVSAGLLVTYERLRGRLGGVGAAPLVGASCGGCHLTLSASELDRARRLPPDAVVTCDQCGRILVR